MRKITLLLLAVTILASCATVPRTHLAPTDAAVLQGDWEGNRDMIWGRYRSWDPARLVIENNAVPLRGVLTVGMHEGRFPVSYAFDNGVLDPEGNLLLQVRPDVRVILSYFNDGAKPKLEGYYDYQNMRGNLVVYKTGAKRP